MHDISSRSVEIWLDQEQNVRRLIDALLATEHESIRSGFAWNAAFCRHRPRASASETEQGALEVAYASRILDRIEFLPDDVLGEAVEGLAAWLDNWSGRLQATSKVKAAIARIWLLAAGWKGARESAAPPKIENATNAEFEKISTAAFNSPIGHLAGAFLQVCPSLENDPHPFDTDHILRNIRDFFANTEGRAGTIARYRCVTQIAYFMRADPTWAELNLANRIKSGPESDALWEAITYSPSRHFVMDQLGPAMIEYATGGGASSEVRRSLIERVTFSALWSLYQHKLNESLFAGVEQMLRSVPDELRLSAANMVERFVEECLRPDAKLPNATSETIFDLAVAPFLAKIWPKERACVTPGIAEAFASLPAACGRRFPEAVAAIQLFLIPFEAWTMHRWGLLEDGLREIAPGVIIGPKEAEAALTLLIRTITPGEGLRTLHGLDIVLEHIAAQNPNLRRDERFRRLLLAAGPR